MARFRHTTGNHRKVTIHRDEFGNSRIGGGHGQNTTSGARPIPGNGGGGGGYMPPVGNIGQYRRGGRVRRFEQGGRMNYNTPGPTPQPNPRRNMGNPIMGGNLGMGSNKPLPVFPNWMHQELAANGYNMNQLKSMAQEIASQLNGGFNCVARGGYGSVSRLQPRNLNSFYNQVTRDNPRVAGLAQQMLDNVNIMGIGWGSLGKIIIGLIIIVVAWLICK